ncbi:MAG: PAS domain S-box protein [Oscillatoriales cyanobacterium RM2_1_1]|nr:PAS domain S-box protein [Oscillatoriales cyanobacterium RM2_1_1]
MTRVDRPALLNSSSGQSGVAFENWVIIAAQIAQTPIAFLSFMDSTHQWLKAQVGFQAQAQDYLGFCRAVLTANQATHALITGGSPHPTPSSILISDTRLDQRTALHPLVNQEPALRFYGGIPLVTPQGQQLGLLSLLDYQPRYLSGEILSILEQLTTQIVNQIENSRQLLNARDKFTRLERIVEERKQVWEVVRQERDFVSSILDTLSALVIVLDAQGQVVRFNSICEQLSGYSQEDVAGKSLQTIGLAIFDLPWEVLVAADEESGDQAATLKPSWFPQEAETGWISPDGTCHLIAWSHTTLLNSDGSVKYVIATGLDITERKRSEEALQESEERYRLIADNSTDLIAQYTCEGIYSYVSPASLELLDYGPEKLVGQSIYQMVHPQDVGNLEQFHQVLIDLGESSAISYRHRHREGHYLWFEATIHPVHDSVTGEIQELVAIARDVTERKQKKPPSWSDRSFPS